MQMRLKALTLSINDPFAEEIRYHASCFSKYVEIPAIKRQKEYLNYLNLKLSDLKNIFAENVRKSIIEDGEIRTLKSLQNDYRLLYQSFGFDKQSHHQGIKNILTEYFGDEIQFKKRPQRNQSDIVFSKVNAGTYAEAALNCWGVEDEQLLEIAAKRLKLKLSYRRSQWPPLLQNLIEIENEQEPLLELFLTTLLGEKKKKHSQVYLKLQTYFSNVYVNVCFQKIYDIILSGTLSM